MIVKNVSKWERSQKDSFQKSSERLQSKIVEGQAKGYDFNDFSQDLFSTLYQARPQLGEATRGTQWAKQALEVMSGLREYKDLRATGTMGNSFQAGLGTICLTSHFAANLPQHETRNPDKIERELQAVEDWIRELEDREHDLGDFPVKASQLRQELQDAEGEWGQPMDEEAVRSAVRKALAQAKEEAQQLESEVEAYGFGDQQGKDGFTSPEAKLALAQKVQGNAKLRQIAELAGRFKREARKIQANKKHPGPDEVTDIETGDAIQRALPAELLMLGDDTLKLEFMRRFAEKSLLQYRLDEPEKTARGPIVVCLDNSGSMTGSPEVWSKAVCLAICRLAMDGKRNFVIIHFDSEVKRVDEFIYPNADPEKLIDSCSYFSGGGTNFDAAFAAAFDVLEKDPKAKHSDIIFITDGECTMQTTSKISDLKKRLGVAIYSIAIHSAISSALVDVSDYAQAITDLSNDADIKETIFSI